MVLLALANHVNPTDAEWTCWPGMARIARMTGYTERTVSKSIAALSKAGLISVTRRQGIVHHYFLTPEAGSGVKEVHPRSNFTPPPKQVQGTPEIDDRGPPKQVLPNRKRIVNESIKESQRRISSSPPIEYPEWLDLEKWDEWKSHLKEKRKPLKPTAEKAQLKKLENWKAQGLDPHEIINNCIARNWQGLFVPETGQHHGKQSVSDKNAEYFRRSERTTIPGNPPIKIINPSGSEDNEPDLPS